MQIAPYKRFVQLPGKYVTVGTSVSLRFVISSQPAIPPYKYYHSTAVVSVGLLPAQSCVINSQNKIHENFYSFSSFEIALNSISPRLGMQGYSQWIIRNLPLSSISLLMFPFLCIPPLYVAVSCFVFSTSTKLRNIVNFYFLIIHIFVTSWRSSQDEDKFVLGWTQSLRSSSQFEESKQTKQLS